MARKLRIQYPGALYHVVNRGNYRMALYDSAGAAKAFMAVVKEAVGMYGWKLYAYALMWNHFHLVIETPEPNLTEGMHWLQSTFGTRFNRYRSERGHLFQGRYHSGLIEDVRMLGHVVDYVHLNPVRAKVVPPDQADRYRWSSLGIFVRGERFKGLTAAEWLAQCGCEDTEEGWRRYRSHLVELANNLELQKELGWSKFSRGWALGSEAWKKSLAADHAHHALNPGLEKGMIRELRDAQWELALSGLLKKEGKTLEEAQAAAKGERWKIQLAERMRSSHGAAHAWLSEKLCLGTPGSARNLISRSRRGLL